MKQFIVFSVICIILSSFSCKKKRETSSEPSTPKTGITYPDSLYYGKSILKYTDSTMLVNQKVYGLAVILEKDASLKIVITNLSPINPNPNPAAIPNSTWFYGDRNGWPEVSVYSNMKQTFIAQSGNNDVYLTFTNAYLYGKCKIELYENSTSVTKTKYLKW